ncbi:SDR family NAD(P)-dependent oxidoreductase [Candidatus Latescibacterota bacterium]
MANNFSLEGKTVFITGANGGIGKAITLGIADAGADLVIAGRNESNLNSTAEKIRESGIKVLPVAFDITDMNSMKNAVKKAVNEFNKIDVLINSAGTNVRKHFLEFEEKDYDLVMDVNAKGLYFLTQEVCKFMAQRKKGKVINIASLNSFIALSTVSAYATSKGAVGQMTKAMAVDMAQYGIQVNAVAPGFIKTPFNELLWGNEEKNKWVADRTLFKRFGLPEDVIGSVKFLSSEESDFITGQIIVVDGGYLAGSDTLFG